MFSIFFAAKIVRARDRVSVKDRSCKKHSEALAAIRCKPSERRLSKKLGNLKIALGRIKRNEQFCEGRTGYAFKEIFHWKLQINGLLHIVTLKSSGICFGAKKFFYLSFKPASDSRFLNYELSL